MYLYIDHFTVAFGMQFGRKKEESAFAFCFACLRLCRMTIFCPGACGGGAGSSTVHIRAVFNCQTNDKANR